MGLRYCLIGSSLMVSELQRFPSIARWLSVILAIVWIVHSGVAADEMPAEVQAILQTRCLSCHNDVDQKGNFSLQSKKSFVDSGFVVLHQSTESHLISVVSAQDGQAPSMPKNGAPLAADEIKSLEQWIDDGAAWPDGLVLSEPVVDSFDWWSLQPIVRPKIPETKPIAGSFKMLTPVDHFISAKHAEIGLTPTTEADRRTLIRRVTYDLTGLPPTLERVEAFLSDSADDAYERLVEELLASPHYGEHWARHWLDVVKYADTCGFDKDKLRANAWPYRDYVIQSFNDDKPYARFVEEQIAGDRLFPKTSDGILGLGFIAAGPWDFIGHVEVPESKQDGMEARNLDRDEMVSNTLNTFCSITIQCARCHNHKFDPFTQEHYYSLQSVFAAVDRAERIYDSDPGVEQRRQELTNELEALNKQLEDLDSIVKTEGGEELIRLDSAIAKLQPLATLATKKPEFGYHSQITSNPSSDRWVEIDLGADTSFSEIRLHACHDEFAGIGAGFGFPVRFRIEARLDAENSGQPVVLSDFTETDFPNPGLLPVRISLPNTNARYVRLIATRLAERKNDYILAIAEVELIGNEGRNVALAARVNALDSIEAPVRWRTSNLTDGIWAQAIDEAAARQLSEAQQQRQILLTTIMTPERQTQQKQLISQRDALALSLKGLPEGKAVYAAATHFPSQGNFKPTEGTPRTVKVLHRGNIQQPKAEVLPGVVPLSSGDRWQLSLPAGHTEADRRAALARWITASGNPLTWRSIANRIWQYHLGQGLVDTPNDLGRMGQLPTHPELLDWLADEFRTTQSFKHMHRLIVNSSTYRQQSTDDNENSTKDSDNQFYWRMNRRKLSAEELRDSILVISNKMDKKMGGPGFYLFALERTEHSPHYEYHKFDPRDAASHRRSIYRFIVRSQPDPFMTTLDCADSSQSTPKRIETLTSLQALSLLNNSFTLAMSEYFAEHLEAAETPDKVTLAFRMVTGRQPHEDEMLELKHYASQHGLSNLCRILFNTSEFLFVD